MAWPAGGGVQRGHGTKTLNGSAPCGPFEWPDPFDSSFKNHFLDVQWIDVMSYQWLAIYNVTLFPPRVVVVHVGLFCAYVTVCVMQISVCYLDEWLLLSFHQPAYRVIIISSVRSNARQLPFCSPSALAWYGMAVEQSSGLHPPSSACLTLGREVVAGLSCVCSTETSQRVCLLSPCSPRNNDSSVPNGAWIIESPMGTDSVQSLRSIR